MGYDVGEKTVGMALSDSHAMIATPYRTLHRMSWKKDSHVLLQEIDDHAVKGIVVGFPLNMNGSEGPRCQSIRQFVANLLALRDIPICLWDERLSTIAVRRTLLEADVSRKKQSLAIDKMAASYILQGCLDSLRRSKAPQGDGVGDLGP